MSGSRRDPDPGRAVSGHVGAKGGADATSCVRHAFRVTLPSRGLDRARGRGRVNDLLGQLFDHAERREILDACKVGDRDASTGRWPATSARTGLEVCELLDPAYDPVQLTIAPTDVGGEIPTKRARKR